MSAEKVREATGAAAMPAAEVVVEGCAPKTRAKRTVTQDVRKLPIINRRVAEEIRELDAADPWPETPVRPKTRGDCLPGGCNEQRPCPWVGCKFHLFLDVKPNGSVQVNFPGGFDRMPETCALDMADRADEPRAAEQRRESTGSGAEDDPQDVDEEVDEEPAQERLPKSHHINSETETLERIGRALHLTRERVRQVIKKAVTRAKSRAPAGTAAAVWEGLEQIAEAPEGASRDTSRGTLPCPVVSRQVQPPTPPAAVKKKPKPKDAATASVFEDLMRKTDPMQVKNRPRRA